MTTPDAAASVFGEALGAAEHYVDILAGRGVEWGLIGPRETDRLWERHVLNSVAVSDVVPQGSTVIDVGSGAGLPGIPLALARPDLMVTLLEPLLRRVNFLELAVAELGLGSRVRVVRGRAEDHGSTYDAVVSRAVAPLPRLLGWCVPLLAAGGRIVALKGESADEEVQRSAKDLRKYGLGARVRTVVPYPGAEPTRLVVCQ